MPMSSEPKSSEESTAQPPQWAFRSLPRGAAAEPLARDWLAAQLGAPAAELPLRRDVRGRPQLDAPFEDFDCNWSHSGEGLLVVLGRAVLVGADVESVRPRVNALELARRYFTAGEAEWIAALDAAPREQAFMRLWCAKEAVLKAHGHGLAFGLHRLEFVQGPSDDLRLRACDPALGEAHRWALREIEPAPGYRGVLAWRERGD